MLLCAFEAARDCSGCGISGHLPSLINFAQAEVVTAQDHRSVVLVVHLLRFPFETFGLILGQHILELFKGCGNISGFVAKRNEECAIPFLVRLEKLFGALY